jgi:hypothetical protein
LGDYKLAFGLAAYLGGVDVVNVAEPFSIIYVVRIKDLKSGTVTFALPEEASSSDVMPFFGPASRLTDITLSMGGATNAKGKIMAISIIGRNVTVTVGALTSYGATTIQISFFNAKGMPCTASN